jgi:MGT family glycosyltransferase
MPTPGHVNPMLAVACHLRDSGHRVIFNTAEVFRNQIESTGIRFVPLEGFANFDYRRLDEAFPERKNFAPGPDQLIHDFKYGFGQPIPDQYRGIRKIMDEIDIDLILTDLGFMGTFPLLLGPRDARPPVISCGVLPMYLSSVDVSPFTAPSCCADWRERNQEENRQFQAMFRPVQDYINEVLNDCGAPAMPAFFLDCLYTLPDVFLQFTAEAFEYARTDMPSSVRFVGPVLPKPRAADFQKPGWWTKLDESRPVVLVTQGTIANEDSSQLIQPALAGLSGEDVMIVVATGGRDLEGISAHPPTNAIIERFIPFHEILPKVDVFVTNGGYGGVNQSLSMGVPVVVAGTTEDKPAVAARVAWSGAGINLGTDRPSSDQVRTAVLNVLCDSGYRRKARILRACFAQYDALDEITQSVESLLAIAVS